MKDFSLVIFDEVHHSNEEPYQALMRKYVTEKIANPDTASQLPQVRLYDAPYIALAMQILDNSIKQPNAIRRQSVCSR